MTRELFAEIVNQQLWIPLVCISIAYSVSWFLGLKLGLLILGVRVNYRVICVISLFGSLYSFWAKQILPLPLVGIGLPFLIALLLWIVARGLHPLKYCWSALTLLVSTFLGGTIFECILSFASPRIGRFLLQTAWGCVVGTGIENIGPVLALILLPRIIPKLKTPLIPSIGSIPDRQELASFTIYIATYCSIFFTTMMTYIGLTNGYPHTFLFLVLQVIAAVTTVVVHFRLIKNLGAEKAALIAEKARLEEVKNSLEAATAKLAADKAKLEAEKAELLKKLRKYAGAENIEAALKSQQIDELFQEFLGRAHSIYNPNPPTNPEVDQAESVPTFKPVNKAKHRLKPREILILKGIIAGKTNREIGDEVFLVEGTVTNHITKLFRKFEVRNREELARFVIENDLIDMN